MSRGEMQQRNTREPALKRRFLATPHRRISRDCCLGTRPQASCTGRPESREDSQKARRGEVSGTKGGAVKPLGTLARSRTPRTCK